ncbi:MAG: LysR substrate-binding domain-containing protein [Rhodobacteraceae bacterium]|nr:LysR substrate-binding domain-containing protein [Paracoccaceae bacterium]
MFNRRYLPSIPALLALEAVDRLGTGAAAAQSLGLSQGAVSHQLKALEDQLGVPLLILEKQRLRLTPAAKDYVAEVRKALQTLANASLSLRANPSGGSLNLSILPAFGMHWLAPRLARFAQAHPEVTVNLSTRLKPFAFEDSRFDAAIHYGREDWPGADFFKLMDEDIIAVTAPNPPENPALLSLESRPGDWRRWFAHHGMTAPRTEGMQFDQFATMMQATLLGLGAALLPTFLIARELADGRLIPLHGGPVRAQGSYYLVWPQGLPPRAPLVSFRAWLMQDMANDGLTAP